MTDTGIEPVDKIITRPLDQPKENGLIRITNEEKKIKLAYAH